MKTLLAIILLTVGASTMAQAHHGGHHSGHHGGHWQRGFNGGWNWAVPAIIGGVLAYEISRNQPPVIVQTPPVILQQQLPVAQPNCSPWTEIQNPDGTITRTRTCAQ